MNTTQYLLIWNSTQGTLAKSSLLQKLYIQSRQIGRVEYNLKLDLVGSTLAHTLRSKVLPAPQIYSLPYLFINRVLLYFPGWSQTYKLKRSSYFSLLRAGTVSTRHCTWFKAPSSGFKSVTTLAQD